TAARLRPGDAVAPRLSLGRLLRRAAARGRECVRPLDLGVAVARALAAAIPRPRCALARAARSHDCPRRSGRRRGGRPLNGEATPPLLGQPPENVGVRACTVRPPVRLVPAASVLGATD